MRVAAVMCGLGGLALTVPTLAASNGKAESTLAGGNGKAEQQAAKAAKCCDVAVDVDRRTVTAGGAPATLTVGVRGTSNGCTVTSRTVAIRLDGLRSDQVRVERFVAGAPVTLAESSPAAGEVVAADALAEGKVICGAADTTSRYRVTFLDEAPSGAARFEVSTATVTGKALGSGAATATVVSPVALPPAPASPPVVTTPPARAVPSGDASASNTEAPAPTPSEEPAAAEPSPSASSGRAPAYTETREQPAAGAPALRGSGQTSGALSAALIAAGLGLTAVVLAGAGVIGWRMRRRLAGSDEDTQPLPPPALDLSSRGQPSGA